MRNISVRFVGYIVLNKMVFRNYSKRVVLLVCQLSTKIVNCTAVVYVNIIQSHLLW